MGRMKLNEKVYVNAMFNHEMKKCAFVVTKKNRDGSFTLVAESMFTRPQTLTLRPDASGGSAAA